LLAAIGVTDVDRPDAPFIDPGVEDVVQVGAELVNGC